MSVDLDSADQDFREAMDLHRRQISEAQMLTFEGYMAEILTAFGMALNTPATGETPRRFIRALFDITDGYDGDPKLLKVFATECRGGPDCRLSQVIEVKAPSIFLRCVSTTPCPSTGMPTSATSLMSISLACLS
jgi:GTP cyclohydrolase I